MIEGVEIKKLNPHLDDRGYMFEFARSDDEFFKEVVINDSVKPGDPITPTSLNGEFQINISEVFPNAVKAWHRHQLQWDYATVIKGNAKLCVVNDRDVSKESKVEINEFFIGEKNPVIIKIPPKMWHGYMALGKEPATILYLVTKPYNHDKPDEERKSWDAFGDIWTVKNR